MLETTLHFSGPLDLAATLGPRAAGAADPTLRLGSDEIVRAMRTPDGPATLHLALAAARPEREGGTLAARAWGPGAAWALAQAREELGLDDVPPALPGLEPLAREAAGLRLGRTRRVVETLVPTVLGQLVTGFESSRALRALVLAFSTPAPGPHEELWLPLGAEELLRIPGAGFPAVGASARQGATLHEVARRARRLEACSALPFDEARRRLLALPGIGPWTAGWTALRALGDPDAVPLGDYHLPSRVAFHLAGEERADDARMLALLEPWRGQRGRVVRWIEAAGRVPPRRGPRAPVRPLAPGAQRLLRGASARGHSGSPPLRCAARDGGDLMRIGSWAAPLAAAAALALGACTQETQNEIGRSIQNWTGTNGVVDVYAGEKLVMRFIHVDKLSTALGTRDGSPRPYRYGYGTLDANQNYQVDPGEKKIYFEVSDFATPYVFYESPR